MRVRVGIVHLAPDLHAPVARHDREPDVEPDGRGDHDDVQEPELIPDDRRHQRELEHRRRGVQDDVADDVLDSRRAALDDPRQPAGAPLQMEAQRETVEVHEGAEGELPDRVQADAGEQRVAHLREAGLDEAADVVGKHQRHRPGDEQRHV